MKDVKVGDILAGSWGYSMRLYTFAEVEKVTPKQVVLRELDRETVGGEMWNLHVRPIMGSTGNHLGTIRVKNQLDKDYVWIPKIRCLMYRYNPDEKYTEDHMD